MAQVFLSGPGTFDRLADVARELGLTHPLLVSDRGILAVGYVDQARRTLRAAGLAVDDFHEFSENPTSDMIEAGRAHAATLGIDGIIGANTRAALRQWQIDTGRLADGYLTAELADELIRMAR